MRLSAAEEFRKFRRMGGLIVEVAEQYVFIRHLPSGGGIEVIRGFEDGCQSRLVVGRHDSAAQLVVGSVQRDGQVILFFEIGEAADLGRQAYRRDGNMSRPDA